MIASSSRRATQVERVDAMRAAIDGIAALDADTLMSGIPADLRSTLAAPRFKERIVMRRARRIVGDALFAPVLDDRESFLLRGGSEEIATLVASAGVHILWEDVLRVVRRTDVDALDQVTGVLTRQVAMRGRSRSIVVAPYDLSENNLADECLREGAISWACWLTTRDPVSARRLRILTPSAIAARIKAIPDDGEMRELRRLVVDIELNAAMGLETVSTDEEVA